MGDYVRYTDRPDSSYRAGISASQWGLVLLTWLMEVQVHRLSFYLRPRQILLHGLTD